MQKLLKDTLIICAMRDEFYSGKYGSIIYYSGIGKVNATIMTSALIHLFNPKTIINLGTVGSSKEDLRNGIECGSFYERDLLLSGDTEVESIVTKKGLYSCGTGDCFVKDPVDYDVVDMEAFAIAKVCKMNHVNFLCYKYITDYLNKEGYNDWKSNISNGQTYFISKINDYFKNSV